jgi:hypothetical protein
MSRSFPSSSKRLSGEVRVEVHRADHAQAPRAQGDAQERARVERGDALHAHEVDLGVAGQDRLARLDHPPDDAVADLELGRGHEPVLDVPRDLELELVALHEDEEAALRPDEVDRRVHDELEEPVVVRLAVQLLRDLLEDEQVAQAARDARLLAAAAGVGHEEAHRLAEPDAVAVGQRLVLAHARAVHERARSATPCP